MSLPDFVDAREHGSADAEDGKYQICSPYFKTPNDGINRAGINCIVRQVDDNSQADSAPVE
jgi:hypothetical protein